jgi:methyltransferase (TIGR00027 family)
MSESSTPLAGVHMTALSAAVMRGVHLLNAAEPKIFRDEFALPLANLTEDQANAFAQMAESVNGPEMAPAWALRSRYTEDRLSARLNTITQYVILGAGLDSYFLRQTEQLSGLTVFEVDDPPMQEWKRRRLQELGLSEPTQVRFVPCDFEVSSVEEALADAGYDDKAPTFISWLGVTQYLTMDAMKHTLRWAARRAGGSEIVLTFVVPCTQAEAIKSFMAARGVRFSTFLSPEQMTDVLHQAGFPQVEHLTLDEATTQYFGGRADGLRVPAMERLVSGIVV